MVANIIRDYEITIGRHDSVISAIEKPFTGGNITEGFITQTVNALRITNHQATIDINASRKPKNGQASPAIVEIYNLNREERASIKADNYIHIKAGYRDQIEDLPLLFAGSILKSKIHKDKEGNVITTLTCGTSPVALTSVVVSGTIEEDVYYRDAIRRLLNIVLDYGVPLGDYDFYSESAQYLKYKTLPNGYTYEGKLIDTLVNLCNDVDYSAYLSAGKIYVRPKYIIGGTPIEYRKVIITPELVKGVAEPSKDTVGSPVTGKAKKSGVTLTTYLNGQITPDKIIELKGFDGDSNVTDGDYSVEDLRYKMDYEGGPWDIYLDLKALGGA